MSDGTLQIWPRSHLIQLLNTSRWLALNHLEIILQINYQSTPPKHASNHHLPSFARSRLRSSLSSSNKHFVQKVWRQGKTLGSTNMRLQTGHRNLLSAVKFPLATFRSVFLEVWGADAERSWLILGGSAKQRLGVTTSWLWRRLAKLPNMYDIWSISIIIEWGRQ